MGTSARPGYPYMPCCKHDKVLHGYLIRRKEISNEKESFGLRFHSYLLINYCI